VDGKDEAPGVLYVGWTSPEEWVSYTVDVQEAGTYTINAHMSSHDENAVISLSFNGEDKSGPTTVKSTGDWHKWNTFQNVAEVKLEKGLQVMTLKFVKQGNMNVDYLEFVPKTDKAEKTVEKAIEKAVEK
jgi:hypothetical protein